MSNDNNQGIIQGVNKMFDSIMNIGALLLNEPDFMRFFPGFDRTYSIIRAGQSISDAILRSKIEKALQSLNIDSQSFFNLISKSDWSKVSWLILDYINRNDNLKTEYIVLLFLCYTEGEFNKDELLKLLFAVDHCHSLDLLILKDYEPMPSNNEVWGELHRLESVGLLRVCYERIDEGGSNSKKIYDLTELGVLFINYMFKKDKIKFIKIENKSKDYYRSL